LDDIKGQYAWELECDILYRSGSDFETNSQFTYMKDINGAGNYKGWAQTQTASLTITTPLTLTATAQWTNALVANILTVRMFYVTKVY
jgi:hypothetical protein